MTGKGVLVTEAWVRGTQRRIKSLERAAQNRPHRGRTPRGSGPTGVNAIIVELGPEGEADFEDNRYWFKNAVAVNAADDTAEQLEITGSTWAGTLSEYVDEETGTVAIANTTTLAAGQLFDIVWAAGRRRDVVAGTVTVGTGEDPTTVEFTGGWGEDLPAEDTEIDAIWALAKMLTNRGECITESHYLWVRQGVHVWTEPDATDPAIVRYFTTFLPWIMLFAVGFWGTSVQTVFASTYGAVTALHNQHFERYQSDPVDAGGVTYKFVYFQGELYGVADTWECAGDPPTNAVVIWWDSANGQWVNFDDPGTGVHGLQHGRDIVVWDNKLWICGYSDNDEPVWYWDGTPGGAWVECTVPGVSEANCLAVYDDDVYVGTNTNLYVYAGSETFNLVGSGLSIAVGAPAVHALHVFDGNLHVGGRFDHCNGSSTTADNVCYWNGSTFAETGDGLPGGLDKTVYALCEYGGDLYAGGKALTLGTYLLHLNGSTWEAVGEELVSGGTFCIYALAEYRGYLLVGGSFNGYAPEVWGRLLTGVLSVRTSDTAGTAEIRRGSGLTEDDIIGVTWSGGARVDCDVDTVTDTTVTKSGTLTVRYAEDSALISLSAGHGFKQGDIVTVEWDVHSRTGMVVMDADAEQVLVEGGSGTGFSFGAPYPASVTRDVTTVEFSGGTGDNLPAADTALTLQQIRSDTRTILNLAAYKDGMLTRVCGGVGDPTLAWPTSGQVLGFSVIDDGREISTVLIGANCQRAAQEYSDLAAMVTPRGMRPLQGGLYGGSGAWQPGLWSILRDGPGFIGVGNFDGGINEVIHQKDEKTVDPVVVSPGLIRWTGQYWEAIPGDGLGNTEWPSRAIVLYDEDIIVAGGALDPTTIDLETGTQTALDADLHDGYYRGIREVDGLLYIYGMFQLDTAALTLASWNGTDTSSAEPIIGGNPAFTNCRGVAMADLGSGDELLAVGERASGCVAIRKSGGVWSELGADLVGVPYGIEAIDYGGAIGVRVYVWGELTLDSVDCLCVELRDDSPWAWHIIAKDADGFGLPMHGATAHFPDQPPCFAMAGNLPHLYDEAETLLEFNNIGTYRPSAGWEPILGGGTNAPALCLG